jgi:NNP family nitrate/nitrite transporter-like MFS transporter
MKVALHPVHETTGTPGGGLAGATLGFFIGFAAVSLFGPTAKSIKGILGLGPLEIGFLVAAPSLSGSLLRIPFSAWVDTTGGKKPFLVLLLLSIAGMAGLFLTLHTFYPARMTPSFYPLILLLGVLCGCGIATFSVGIGQVSYWYPKARQGTALGTYAGIGNLAPGIFTLLLPVALLTLGLAGSYLAWLAFLAAGTCAYAVLGRNAWFFQMTARGIPREEARAASALLGQEIFPSGSLVESLLLSARSWKTWALVGIYFTTFGGFIAMTAWLPVYWTSFFAATPVLAGVLAGAYSIVTSIVRVGGGVGGGSRGLRRIRHPPADGHDREGRGSRRLCHGVSGVRLPGGDFAPPRRGPPAEARRDPGDPVRGALVDRSISITPPEEPSMRERAGSLSCLLLLSLFLSAPVWADSGKELFEKECSGCHTIGGGESGGPDLSGVAGRRPADWLERIIVEPDRLTADKDPVQLDLVKKYGGEMPNVGMSRKDARKIIAYLQGISPAAPPAAASGAVPPPEPAPKAMESAVTPELVALGKALFTGGKPFANGGAPCAACHSFGYSGVTWGALAADLGARAEAVGEPGLRGMLKSLNFPIMRKSYDGKPLTDEEITALVVFAKDAVARKAPPSGAYFPAAGIGVFACLIVGLMLYQRRIR